MKPPRRYVGSSSKHLRDKVIAGIEGILAYQVGRVFKHVLFYKPERANSRSGQQRRFYEFEDCNRTQQPGRVSVGHCNRLNGSLQKRRVRGSNLTGAGHTTDSTFDRDLKPQQKQPAAGKDEYCGRDENDLALPGWIV